MSEVKKLFIIITDSGDGSNGLCYTFDADLISYMQNNEELLNDSFQSGDGLQVRTLNVPVECTYESLGISNVMLREYLNFEDEEEEY